MTEGARYVYPRVGEWVTQRDIYKLGSTTSFPAETCSVV